jgi:putative membrane protein insertion efficiency factor
MNLAQKILIAAIRVYQLALSPWLGRQCRFLPTCSEYGKEAIEVHGALKGGWLAAKRIGRCHPGGVHGYDPVPPADSMRSGFNKEDKRT